MSRRLHCFILPLLILTLTSCTSMRTFNVDGAPAAIGPYSHAAVCNGHIMYLSGQIGLRPDGTMVDGGVQEQTQQIFANIRTILASQGASLSNVVKTTVFLRSMNDFQTMNAEYALAFGDHKPARSAVEVSKLPKDALVEIEVIVCLP